MNKENEWRRFKPKGNKEEMEKLNRLLEKKNISRADLILIFKNLEPIWENIL